MRKVLFMVFVFGIGQVCSAQSKNFSIGLALGLNGRLNSSWDSFNHEFSDVTESSWGLQINYQKRNQTWITPDGSDGTGDPVISSETKFGLRAGISYSKKEYKVVYAWVLPDGSDGSGDPTIPLVSDVQLNYIDIPVNLYYRLFTKNNYSLSPYLGIANSINIGYSGVHEMGDGSINESTWMTPKDFLTGIRIGLINNVAISDYIFISFEPYVMRDSTNPRDIYILSSPWTFGGILSVNCKLNIK